MACCAFALFLLSQILLSLQWLRTRLFGEESAAQTRPNKSVEWSFDRGAQPALTASARPRGFGPSWFKRGAVALVAIELVVLTGGAIAGTARLNGSADASVPASARSAEMALLQDLHESVCGSLGRG